MLPAVPQIGWALPSAEPQPDEGEIRSEDELELGESDNNGFILEDECRRIYDAAILEGDIAHEPAAVDLQEIARTLRMFVQPGGIGEVRVGEYNGIKRFGVYFDYDQIDEVTRMITDYSQTAKAVHVVMNELVAETLDGRPRPRLTQVFVLTRNIDVARRRWLLIDFDPQSPERGKDSATNAEKTVALARMRACLAWLLDHGFSPPIWCDSGNGWHLLFRIDLPNDQVSSNLVKAFLLALSDRFSDDQVTLDKVVHNVGRITKCYGSVSRKGEHSPERPHRASRVLLVPAGGAEIVHRVLLERVVTDLTPAAVIAPSRGRAACSTGIIVVPEAAATCSETDDESDRLNVEAWLLRHGQVIINRDVTADGAERWFIECPVIESHTGVDVDTDCCVTQEQSGRLGGKCFHASCGMADWQSLKAQIGPIGSEDFPPPGIGDVGSYTTAPVRNFQLVTINTAEGLKQIRTSLPIPAIVSDILLKTGNWPRQASGMLFVTNLRTDGVFWLENTNSLFAYLGERTNRPPEFLGGIGMHTKSEVFENIPRAVITYAAVEVLPHEPLMADHFYACNVPESGDGSRLNELVDMFSPETCIDRDLIYAAFVTPFWGGRGGKRPAFGLTSDAGRGAGKTTLAACMGEMAGGVLELSTGENIEAAKTRLLSPNGMTKRVVLLDNVKSLRFSWADLEALITAFAISGKRNYEGEGTRPNNLTYVFTLNGASLCTDIAQRTVLIKLSRPDYSGTWADDVRRFIDTHRQELIADVLGFLRRPVASLERFSRWGDWERDILAKLPNPAEAQRTIRERQAAADVEVEETELIEEYFARRLAALNYSPTADRVFIPARIAAEWMGLATNDKTTVLKASRIIRQKIEEGGFKRIMECLSRTHGRGFEWWGADSTGVTPLQQGLQTRIDSHQSGSEPIWP